MMNGLIRLCAGLLLVGMLAATSGAKAQVATFADHGQSFSAISGGASAKPPATAGPNSWRTNYCYTGELTGFDYMTGEDPALCAQACTANERCRFWSFRAHDLACLMNTERDISGEDHPDCVSGEVPARRPDIRAEAEQAGYRVGITHNGEMTGYEQMSGPDPSLCAQACRADPDGGCRFWTYRIHDHACLMYTARGLSEAADDNGISGRRD